MAGATRKLFFSCLHISSQRSRSIPRDHKMNNWNKFFAISLVALIVVIALTYRNQSEVINWRAVVCERQMEHVTGYLLPRDDVIDAMSNDELTIAYWRYVSTLQVVCYDQQRMGSLRDGGKEVCIDKEYRPNSPCIVYSFGSNFKFDFEEAVLRDFKCEIHTFDPSQPLTDKVKIPSGVTFHLTGLYGKEKLTPADWKMETFSSIKTSLGHEHKIIDIVKMDIEGSEWGSIDEMIETGSIRDVKQLCVEWHLGERKVDFKPGATKKWGAYLKTLRRLYEVGFRMFMHEDGLHHTLKFKNPYPEITTLIEISYINIRFHRTGEH